MEESNIETHNAIKLSPRFTLHPAKTRRNGSHADFRFLFSSFGEQIKDLSQQGLSLVCALVSVPATNLKQAVSLFLQRAVGVSLLVILQRVVAILQDAPQNQLETQFLQWIVAILMLPWYRTNVTLCPPVRKPPSDIVFLVTERGRSPVRDFT